MNDLININQTFEKINFTHERLNNREFDGCVFKNCDFSSSDLSMNAFIDCEFIDCNLSMVKLAGTSLKSVVFRDCKLLGILFHECDDFLFGVHFYDCALDYASFANKKMHKTHFSNCALREVTFGGTDLTKSIFDNCNLENAIFNNSKLNDADFRTAYNYTIDPEFNPMKKARFSIRGIPGLLEKYDIKIL